jgi:hypothetical protein
MEVEVMSIRNDVANTAIAPKNEPHETDEETPSLQPGQHWCRCCAEEHAWTGCDDVTDYYLACDEFRRKLNGRRTQ